jgi:hypothetical protein
MGIATVSAADLGAGRLNILTHSLTAAVSRGWRPIVRPLATALACLATWCVLYGAVALAERLMFRWYQGGL